MYKIKTEDEKGRKKVINMLILEILKEYTDIDHRLTQQEIIKLLKSNYNVECDRRTVNNNIKYLKDLDYDINTDNGTYLGKRDFEEAEIRMLIDSVLFSKDISVHQAKELIKKLCGLGNKYFKNKVTHIHNLPYLSHADNKQSMLAVEIINDAISENKKISFTYNAYGTDFKLHPKRAEKYIVNPIQMVANNGFYYLIGNYDAYDDISHYRIDKMTDIEILSEMRKKQEDIKELEGMLDLPKHMAEHIYMYSGPSVAAHIKTKKDMMNELIDWFGKDFSILEEEGDIIIVRVTCNEQAMLYWALQYGTCAEILKPLALREKVLNAAKDMVNLYN